MFHLRANAAPQCGHAKGTAVWCADAMWASSWRRVQQVVAQPEHWNGFSEAGSVRGGARIGGLLRAAAPGCPWTRSAIAMRVRGAGAMFMNDAVFRWGCEAVAMERVMRTDGSGDAAADHNSGGRRSGQIAIAKIEMGTHTG